MADNVTIPATGSGTATPVVATDDVGGVHYQYVKLVSGTADASDKIAGDATNGLDVDVTRITGGGVASGAADSGNPVKVGGKYNASPVTLADGNRGDAQLDVNGYLKVNVAAGATDSAHDAVDTGNPVKIGYKAVAHGSNPTAVAAADRTDAYANRHGIPFVLGGHMNSKSATYITTSAGTDDNVLPVVATGTKIGLTRITITLDEATTVGVAVRLGFGTSVVPALGASQADAVDHIIVYHPGMVPGSGIQIGDGSGIVAIGGDDMDLRITNEVPTGGTLAVSVTYFTIES